jgi:hypothetical protein
MILPGITEAEFTKQVIQYAKLHGWKTAHFRPALSQSGKWMTAVQGDGKGFPDLVLVRSGELIFAELKVGKNKETAEQREWIDAINTSTRGVRAYIWRPDQWGFIETILKR